MFGKQRLHAGINVNDRSIELVIVDNDEHPKCITHAARVELTSGTVANGRVLNQQLFLRALTSLKGQAHIPESQRIDVTLSVSEDLVFPFTVPLSPLEVKNPSRINSLIESRAQEIVPLSIRDRLLFIVTPTTDHTRFVYAIDGHSIRDYEELFGKLNMTIDHVEPESIALTRFLLPDVHLSRIAMFIDIGTAVTRIITLEDGKPLLSMGIPFGAEQLVVAQKSNSLAAFAKEIKLTVNQSLTYLKDIGQDSSNRDVYLFGGGTLIPRIAEEIQRSIGLVHLATLGRPLQCEPFVDKKKLAMFAHSIGSSLRIATNTAGQRLQQLKPQAEKPTRTLSISQFKNRATYLIAIFIVLLLALIVLLFVTKPGSQQTVQSLRSNKTALNTNSKTIDSFSLDFSIGSKAPAVELRNASAEESLTVQTTGIAEQDKTAEGTVTFFNTTSNDKVLVAGTRIASADGIIFRTAAQVTIPAKGSATAKVNADQPGEKGNVTSGHFTIPGLNAQNQQLIYAESTITFTGGKETHHVVAESDITNAQATLKEKLSAKLETELNKPSDEKQLVSFIPSATLFTLSSTKKTGEQAEELTLTLKATGYAAQFAKDELTAFAKERLGSSVTIESISIGIDSFDAKEKTGTVHVRAQWH